MATNTCLLYGTTNWVNVNILVILAAFMIVAVMYALSNTMPTTAKERLKEAAKSELTQGVISVFIIIILAGVATTACSLTSGISMSLTHQSMSPFQYSEYYVGNLSANTGLNLLTNVYSTSVTYAVEAQVLQTLGSFLNTQFSSFFKILFASLGISSIVTLSLAPVIQLSALFSILSTVFLSVIAPLVTIVVGLLFVQFLLLPILQYTAFSVVLPVAIVFRSIPFMGAPLKGAANSMLAIAIAGYIVYPLMVSFNGYMIAWIFSASNPSFQYIGSTYVVPNIPVSSYFSTNAGVTTGTSSFFGNLVNTLEGSNLFTPFLTSSFNSAGFITPFNIVQNSQLLINETAQFLFAGVVLFVIDIAVTIGFAVGLAKALNSGIGGAGSFWSGI